MTAGSNPMASRKTLIPLLFFLLILALASIGPDAPADDPAPAPQAATSPQAEEAEPPESFEPSEKLPADSAVSFPVDI